MFEKARRPGALGWRAAAALFAAACAVYAAFTHGGILSPDAEVAFRTAESLAFRGTFAVDRYLDQWPGFGFARGTDGRLYSRYQPLQPLLLAPIVRLAEPLSRCVRLQRALAPVPGSHYVTWDPRVVQGGVPSDPAPHLLRFLVVLAAIPVSALQVVLFALAVAQLTGCARAAWLSGLLFAFCTPELSYAGTLFKEPLVGVLTLGSFCLLLPRGSGSGPGADTSGCQMGWPATSGRGQFVRPRPEVGGHQGPPTVLPQADSGADGGWDGRGLESAFGSGLLAGLAVATHLLAALTVPFLGLLAVALAWRRTRRVREGARVAVAWGLGVLPSLVCLAWFNEYRFGSFLDTGFRASAAEMLEQRFVAPLVGISGLLFSAGKGLAFYCPLAVVAAAFWPSFWRKHRLVAAFVLLLSAARLAFVGSFRDWHGGFCLGPRYLLGVVPFLLLPLAAGIEDLIASRRRGPAAVLWVAAGLCLCQQIVLGAGEIFSYLYGVKWRGLAAGLDVFRDDYLYFSWRVSPLLHLLEGQRGPWLLRRIAAGNTALAGLLCALGLVLLLWAWIRAFRTTQPLATGKKP